MQNAKSTKPAGSPVGRNQQTFLFTVIGAGIVVAILFILISSTSTRSSFDEAFFAGIHQERLPDGGFILGDPDAAVTIVEFQDWYCPHCQDYKPTADQFIREYVATGKARYEFRALTTAGANAQPNTSQLYSMLECIENQKPGSFFYASDLAYSLILSGERGAGISQALAERTGADYAAMLRCTQDEATQATADVRLATSVGASSTPALYYRINNGTPQPVGDRSFNGLASLVDAMASIQ